MAWVETSSERTWPRHRLELLLEVHLASFFEQTQQSSDSKAATATQGTMANKFGNADDDGALRSRHEVGTLEPALHEDLGAAASTTLERSAGTGSHGAKPTRERRRSCATTSRRRRAGCARLRASSAASRGPRWRVHALKRHVQVRWWWWWWVVGDKSAKFSQQASQNLGKYFMKHVYMDVQWTVRRDSCVRTLKSLNTDKSLEGLSQPQPSVGHGL